MCSSQDLVESNSKGPDHDNTVAAYFLTWAWMQVFGRALLPPGIQDRIVVVHDNEPTSVVAYFLSKK